MLVTKKRTGVDSKSVTLSIKQEAKSSFDLYLSEISNVQEFNTDMKITNKAQKYPDLKVRENPVKHAKDYSL